MAEVLTEQQRAVVTDRGGKLLVSAAAGSGKTKVLVDRLLLYITESGGIYDYLPFMIYPIYNILDRMDKSYAEAAADLGATPWQVFWKVQVPLSAPGVISGIMMVFMPTVSTFAISEFLTNNKIKLFGTIIQENINSSMWNYGAALSLVMLVIIGITSLLQDNKKEVSGGIV